MKRTVCFAALAAMATSSAVPAPGSLAQVTIIDRDTGVALSPHLFHGEYWVAGRPGATYSIEIRNRLGERLLAVTAVDGVNVVSGATAGWNQIGYVFGPGESYEITGWRKSDAEVAAFTFTDLADSYAARTGRPANVGIIGVALFREGQSPRISLPPPATLSVPTPPPVPVAKAPATGHSIPEVVVRTQPDHREQSLPAPGASAAPIAPPTPSAAPAPFASSAPFSASIPVPDTLARAGSSERGTQPPGSTSTSIAPEQRTAPKLGTGHGVHEYSFVSHTEFERLQTEPNEIIRIRYDSLDNLVAMGILARPRPAVPAANPFPASAQQQYVPDPPTAVAGELQ